MCIYLTTPFDLDLTLRRPVTHTCSYMATISLEDYGPCITLASSSNELKLATDDYSITALKVTLVAKLVLINVEWRPASADVSAIIKHES